MLPRRPRTIAGWWLAGLSALALVAFLAAIVVHLPPARERVLRWLQATARRTIDLDLRADTLDYNLFTLSVSLDHVVLAAASSPDAPFLQADRVAADLQWSIVRGGRTLDRVELDRPRVSIAKRADGSWNLPEGRGTTSRAPGPFYVNALVVRDLQFSLANLPAVSLEATGVGIDLAQANAPSVAGSLTAAGGVQLTVGDHRTAARDVRAAVAFDGRDVTLQPLHMAWDEGTVDFSGRVRSVFGGTTLDGALDATVDLAKAMTWIPVDAAVTGTATARGTVTGPVGAPTFDLDVAAPTLTWNALEATALTSKATWSPRGLDFATNTFGLAGGTATAAGHVAAGASTPGDGPATSSLEATWTGVDVDATISGVAGPLPLVLGARATGHTEISWAGPFAPRTLSISAVNDLSPADAGARAGARAAPGAMTAGHLELVSDGDRIAENNRGLGAVSVSGARAVLVLNDDGAEDPLTRALRAAKLPVKVSTPEAARLDALALTAYRAVILENVAAGRLGRGLARLNDFVTERGGGLLVTGGRASFGTGGYFKSTLDPLLPVSMEMRQEHRKQAVALAITMDRSGSMAADVGGGLQKMDLANLGAAAAIELLSPLDSVGVIAVDSSPHVVQELTRATDTAELVARVRRIESMGGGVYSYTALLAAGKMLEDAEQLNRHVIFFADAADAEEHENCAELLAKMVQAGVTTSVIALGTRADSDAQFLEECARIGQGQVYFTTDASELPRLFAQDTLTAARSTFVEEATATQLLPGLFGVGEVTGQGFAELGGYNLTYLRAGAVCGVVTSDDYHAPAFAFHYQGLGRVAAFTGQIGGKYGASVVAWPGFASFFVSAARWLVGQEEPADLFTRVRRDGKDVVVEVEQDEHGAVHSDTTKLEAHLTAADGTQTTVLLERVGENRFEARQTIAKEGITLGTLRLADGKFVTLPPVALPYSPEFEPSPDPQRGERLLRKLAEESGGIAGVNPGELWRGERSGNAWKVITRELVFAALLALLLEIAVRRLQLARSLRLPKFVTRWRTERAARSATTSGASATRGSTANARGTSTAPLTTTTSTSATASRTSAPAESTTPPAPPPAEDMTSVLQRAKRSADRRLDR